MANTTQAVADYVGEVSRLAKTGKATEHTFRGALAALLDTLAPGLKAVNEPKRTDCGAPDYIVQNKSGLGIFYVEAKDLDDDDLDGRKRTGHKEQFDRYKAALDTIIFTDYLDFHLYRHGQLVSAVRIADWDGVGKVSGRPGAYADLAALVADAAAGVPQMISSARRLAELMAGKARLLQGNSAQYLAPAAKAYDDAPDGAKPPVTPILGLLLGMRDVLMPDVGADEFSDIFAQTLTYGMFAARLNDPTPKDFSRYEAMALIPKTNPFLKQLFQYVANNLEDELEWMVDDLADLFRSADVAKIMDDYGRTGADPMIHFYEDFLAAYDAGLRKDRGVWYTPIQVVKFIVRAVDWALRTRFGLPDGLADRSKVEIECEEIAPWGRQMARKVKKTVHRIQLLDPATGTGTFIAEAIRQIFAKFKGNEGMWPGYVESDLLPRLNGFELLMASYTMAHIKIDMALRETGATPSGKERFRVFLTDSLSDWHKELPGGLFASALAPEQQGADEVKRDTPVMVVMGNPPYSGESQNKGDWIMKLMEAYKVEPGGKTKLQERNPKWLNDDYVKFLRLAEHYVEKNGEGIVAYITPHGFLDNPTFRGMRWHLMQTFDEIWTLNLHGNSKKKEVAPDGGKDECVFNIMQGVAITLFVKKGNCLTQSSQSPQSGKSETSRTSRTSREENNCRVYYADLWGRRADKLSALDNATMESVKWQEVQPTEPMLFFTPRDTTGEAEWNAGFGVNELFGVGGSGITSAHDDFVSGSTDVLVKRFEEFRDSKLHENLYKKFKVKEKSGWDIHKGYSELQGCNDIEKYIKPFAYRLFDRRHIFYQDSLVWRSVRKIFNHFLLGTNVGIVVLRGFPKESPPAFVTDAITEHRYWSCSGMQGTDYVFPLYLYEESMGKVEKRANLDKDIVGKLRASASPREELSPEDIFDYIYGVLHSPDYRAKFKEFLKVDFPRIPYPKDAAEFERFREAGHELRVTHLMKDAEPPLSETRARFPVAGDNAVDKVEWDAGRVHINATQYFDNVPAEAWEQQIGGYRPAEKWLKDRKGRTLTQDDLKHYQRIILALAKTREIMNGLQA
jgi:predicted helicase